MNEVLPVVNVSRPGDTASTISRQHRGLTDLPLPPSDEINASRIGDRLKGLKLAKVFSSPVQRASRTCELAGFGAVAEILAERPDWKLLRDGCPGNKPLIGRFWVATAAGWFAVQPPGNENTYKIGTERIRHEDHLSRIPGESQQIVSQVLDYSVERL
jgi:Histidine phosphatase superfamily (branch 1)